MIEDQIDQNLKSAMLARDGLKTDTLRGLKSVILYSKVASNTRDEKLADQEVINLLSKESKKRQESADLYKQGGEQERADKELTEKAIIDEYLPKQLGEDELNSVIDEIMGSLGNDANMGQIIGMVKQKTAGAADGSAIARLVKEKLNQ
jgi:uncharacterized protein YqeY